MTNTASVYVQDHSFILGDAGATTPFGAMDFSTGLAGTMETSAMVYAGVDRGTVVVSVDAVDSPPVLDTPEHWDELAAWDDVAEVTLAVPNGELRVDRLEYGPTNPRVALPVLSPSGAGHYRVRIHARGRDRHYDQVVDDSGESFYLITWPQPPAPPLIIKATSKCGYGLRLAHLHNPFPPAAPGRTREQEAEATQQAVYRRALGGQS